MKNLKKLIKYFAIGTAIKASCWFFQSDTPRKEYKNLEESYIPKIEIPYSDTTNLKNYSEFKEL